MCKIIFSLTAHENVECLHDLIDNIRRCFIHYDIMILLSLTYGLCGAFDNKYDFVTIVSRRPDTFNIRATIHLFHQHMLNMKYLCDNCIQYDYFWFVASNEMFIKIVPPTFVDDNCLKILGKKNTLDDTTYDTYYNNMMTSNHDWYWIQFCRNDTNFVNWLRNNKFRIGICQHEGLVLPRNLMIEIYEEYTSAKLYECSTFEGYVMEEIFIATYICNKYYIDDHAIKYYINYGGLKPFCFIYMYTMPRNSTYDDINKNLENFHLSIKLINRCYNDPIRCAIRKQIEYYENNDTAV